MLDTVNNSDASLGANGLPVITTDIALDGHGATVTRNTGEAFRLFQVASTGTLRLNDVILSGGLTDSDSDGGHPGGCIANNGGRLILTNTTVTDNATADSPSGIGRSGGDGGGIYNNQGTLTLTNTTISRNRAGGGGGFEDTVGYGAAGGSGGGLFNNGGTVTLTNSTVTHNIAGSGHRGVPVGYSGGAGGGIVNDRGTLALISSTVSANGAGNGGQGGCGSSGGWGGEGGGIANTGTLRVTNSTISGNTAGGGGYGNPGSSCGYSGTGGGLGGNGGGIDNRGSALIINSTLSGNSSGSGGGGFGIGGYYPNGNGLGGGIANDAGNVTLHNTIVSDNEGGDCAGPITAGRYNLGTDSSCGGTVGNPMLAPLSNNGGFTQTMALQPGSAAINAGDNAICAGWPVNNLDQRGFARPGIGASQCSIGAYEFNSPSSPTRTVTPVHCAGDCSGDGSVTVDELVAMVKIALGEVQVSACEAGDTNHDRQITIDEILTAVNEALDGCSRDPAN